MTALAQPCDGCLFWYGRDAFFSGSGDGLAYCEIVDEAPTGPCDKALFPLRREVRGLPSIRTGSPATARAIVQAMFESARSRYGMQREPYFEGQMDALALALDAIERLGEEAP